MMAMLTLAEANMKVIPKDVGMTERVVSGGIVVTNVQNLKNSKV